MRVSVEFNGQEFLIDVDEQDTLEYLKGILFSLTDVAPQHQRLSGFSKFKPNPLDSDLLSELGVHECIKLTLNKTVPPLQNPVLLTPNAHEKEFIAKLQSYREQVLQYEDPFLLSKCLSIIPVPLLTKRAEEEEKANEPPAPLEPSKSLARKRDYLLRELMKWFKTEFFSWVDKPKCDFCGGESTVATGGGIPTEQERRGGASRIEVYSCTLCHSYTRFPRYNKADKLLETRKGRCGEWAQAFTLCCRALGFDARFVVDWTDHVWTEVYSNFRGKWCHCDPCENAFDKPLLYELGWGKKLSFVIAFSADEVVDVTRRYTRKWNEVVARRSQFIKEDSLQILITGADMMQRFTHTRDEQRKAELQARREYEQKELEGMVVNQAPVDRDGLVGRISGSEEWRKNRGECGVGVTTSSTGIAEDPNEVAEVSQFKQVYSFDPVQTAQLKFAGSATCVAQKGLVLTPAKNDQRGAVWVREQYPVALGFSTEFTFSIVHPGADGFAFVIQAHGEDALGLGGCELGYGGLTNSLAIEFDMYYSYDRCDDPDGNHISIHTRRDQPNSANHRYSLGCASEMHGVPTLADGKQHDVRIQYVHRKVKIWIDRVCVLQVAVDLSEILGDKKFAWVGFTAATGGICQEHRIHQWSFKCGDSGSAVTSTCVGATFTPTTFKHIPVRNCTALAKLSVDGVMKKLTEFNNKLKQEDQTQLVLTPEDIKELESILGTLPQDPEKSSLNERQASIFSLKLLKWPLQYLFPVVDILRVIILSAQSSESLQSGAPRLLEDILKLQDSTSPNQLVMLRFINNAFLSTPAEELKIRQVEILDAIKACLRKGSSKATLQTTVSALLNFVSFFGASTNTMAHPFLCEILLKEDVQQDRELVYRALQILGTFLYHRKSSDIVAVKEVLNTLLLKRKTDTEVCEVIVELFALHKQRW